MLDMMYKAGEGCKQCIMKCELYKKKNGNRILNEHADWLFDQFSYCIAR